MDSLQVILLILLTIIILLLFLLIYFVTRRKTVESSNVEKMLPHYFTELINQGSSLKTKQDFIEKEVSKSNVSFQNLEKELINIKSIGSELSRFSQMLKSPTARGSIGEIILGKILENYLPDKLYKLQYTLKSGVRCDAAIFSSESFLAIDSKFPLENFIKYKEESESKANFLRACKSHIDDIAKKYIQPSIGTEDFALMYIPSEAVYYEMTITDHQINEYASSKKVIIVSPNTFWIVLKLILTRQRQTEFQANASSLLRHFAQISQEFSSLTKDLSVVQKHFQNSSSALEKVLTNFNKSQTKLENLGKTTSLEIQEKIGT